MALHDHWPLVGLRVRTPRLALRYPDDDLLAELAELACHGVHPPDTMPFSVPWTEAPVEELGRNVMQYHWRCRAEVSPVAWRVDLVTLLDGVVVGSQGIASTNFPVRRAFGSGSWLGLAHQGAGIGTEMRRAVLHLGFAGFGAERAETEAWHDNAASLAVTRKLGYRSNGESVEARRGEPTTMLRFALTRADWEDALRNDDIELEGVDACLPLLVGDGQAAS